jgi:hypothetical protein
MMEGRRRIVAGERLPEERLSHRTAGDSMSDSGNGKGPRFSEIYRDLKSSIPWIEDGERVHAAGTQLYAGRDWLPAWSEAAIQERADILRAGADHVRAAIDLQYGEGVGQVIFSSAGRRARRVAATQSARPPV